MTSLKDVVPHLRENAAVLAAAGRDVEDLIEDFERTARSSGAVYAAGRVGHRLYGVAQSLSDRDTARKIETIARNLIERIRHGKAPSPVV